MIWILKKLCCFNTDNEKNNYYHYHELQNIDVKCQINKKIYDLLNFHDFDELNYFKVYDLYLYIRDSTAFDFVRWNLKEYWIIELHKKLLEQSPKHVEYIDNLISKLITYFFFFNYEHNQTCINFLMFRKDLFNFNLWIDLLICPDYNHDRIILEKTAFLHSNKFFNIFDQFKYYNLDYNLFELILLGKMELNQEKTQLFWIKFFDLNAVLFFIDKLNITLLVDNYLLKSFEILLKSDTVDKEYINTIIKKINLAG
jgi:hypothetical protein